MHDYKEVLFEDVNNREYIYYKVVVDDICYFDEFYEKIKEDIKLSKKMNAIIAYMDIFGADLLPEVKFRQIKGVGRDDVFEFKKSPLRVYVIKQKPNIYIIMGGMKPDQKKDIKLLKTRIKGFKQQ